MTTLDRSWPLRRWRLLTVVALLTTAGAAGLVSGAIYNNAFDLGERFESLLERIDRFIAGPPPDRLTRVTILVTPRPIATPNLQPETLSPAPSSLSSSPGSPSADPSPPGSTSPASPTPGPPVRTPVDVDIVNDPEAVFRSQVKKDWCSPAAVQIVLAIWGRADTSEAFQRKIHSRVQEWESWKDSHNGEWGPAAMAEALSAYGASGYAIWAYESRADALRDAAAAINATGAPVILLAWRGAHTWVMHGYRASADPSVFADAKIGGTYILDPWYPRISTIWGASDPPGTFQDDDEMKRNFLPWKRPEGRYPDRDGLFIILAPTIPLGS